MPNVKFLVEDNIAIPKRTVDFGPRESQYDVLLDMQPGQSFAIPISGRSGQVVVDKETGAKRTLSVVEDAKAQGTQKQSYLSAYTRRHGIKIVTRYFAADGAAAAHLRVWHDGYRDAAEGAEAAQGDDDGAVEL